MNDILLLLLPGMMYFWVLFIGQGPLQEILHEKEKLILPRLLATPVTLPQYLLAKMGRSFLLCVVVLAALILSSAVLFRIHWGNPWVVCGVTSACAVSMMGQLAVIHSLARTAEQANVISSIVILSLALVGGSMFPFESLPGFLKTIGAYTPNRWAVLAWRGAASSKSILDLLPMIGGLVAVGVVGALLSMFGYARQLGHGRFR